MAGFVKGKEKAILANAYWVSLTGEFLPSPQSQREEQLFLLQEFVCVSWPTAPKQTSWQPWHRGKPITREGTRCLQDPPSLISVTFLVFPITDTG